jgi:hypothetical protein
MIAAATLSIHHLDRRIIIYATENDLRVKKKLIAIVIPIYKDSLSPLEFKRISITLKNSGPNSVFFIHPSSLNLDYYRKTFQGVLYKSFEDSYFKSRDSYNSLVLEEEFYQQFREFSYILICQSDAFIIRDISPLANLDYDYIGAVWNPPYIFTRIGKFYFVNRPQWIPGRKVEISVGNGGLSLRKVKSMIDIIKHMKNDHYWNRLVSITGRKVNEDLAFSYYGHLLGYKFPSIREANEIFIESGNFSLVEMGHLFGFHALNKFAPELEKEILLSYL